MQHILLSLSKRSLYSESPAMPEDAIYNPVFGVWTIQGDVLVRTEEFISARVSKKADQETGEDQKGEW
jgi:hypothetical protein